jgi:hypothetical protein
MYILIVFALIGKYFRDDLFSALAPVFNHNWHCWNYLEPANGGSYLELASLLYADGWLHTNTTLGLWYQSVCDRLRVATRPSVVKITLFRFHQTDLDLCGHYVPDLHVQSSICDRSFRFGGILSVHGHRKLYHSSCTTMCIVVWGPQVCPPTKQRAG